MTDIVHRLRAAARTAPEWLTLEADAADEIERLRAALVEIRDHWATSYDHQYANNEMYRGPYGIGIVDGHRLCAAIARKALEKGD